jgi:hypothetical protein
MSVSQPERAAPVTKEAEGNAEKIPKFDETEHLREL